jgi:predicted short-subunit dehydrogenase-like oxidoreductase (DUF2520 family)
VSVDFFGALPVRPQPQPLAVHSSGLGSVHLLKPLYEQGVRVLCRSPKALALEEVTR